MPIIALSGEQAAARPEGAALAAAASQGGAWPPRPSDRVLALEHDGAWTWLALWRALEFDSEVFGLPLGLAELMHAAPWPDPAARQQGTALIREMARQARQEGLAGLSTRVGEKDFLATHALEAAGARLMDASVTWELALDGLAPPPAVPGGLELGPWRGQERGVLLELAAAAFCDPAAYADRFALDPRLSPGCPDLYRRWMANSLDGEQADQVLSLRGPEVMGFITLKLGQDGGPAWVVLNAVAPDQRGGGRYNLLLAHGLAWLAARGATHARVRTKFSQRAVIRAWSRRGARPLAGDFTFHLWMDEF